MDDDDRFQLAADEGLPEFDQGDLAFRAGRPSRGMPRQKKWYDYGDDEGHGNEAEWEREREERIKQHQTDLYPLWQAEERRMRSHGKRCW